MQNFTVNIILDGYERKNGTHRVTLDVWFQKRHYPKPLPITVTKDQFVAGVIEDHPEAQNYNSIITAEKSRVNMALLTASHTGDLTPQKVKSVLKTGKKKKHDLGNFYDFIEHTLEKLSGTLSPKTIKAYEWKLESLREWRPTAPWRDITQEWVYSYVRWLKYEKKIGNNTIYDKENFLHKMLSEAVPKYLAQNPMKGMTRTKFVDKIPFYLEDDQIERLTKLVDSLGDSSLKTAGMYFLADMEIGVRVSDLMNFDPKKDIKDGRFRMETSKGKTVVAMKVSDRLVGYMEYLKTHPLDLSISSYDRLLKELSRLMGLNPRLSAHVARHTLGRRLAKANINVKVAQQILGHRRIESTLKYYHIDSQQVDDAIDALK